MTEHPHPGFSDFHLPYFFSFFLVNSFHRVYLIKEDVLSPAKGLCHEQADGKNIFWYKCLFKHSCKLTIFVTDYLGCMEI